MQLPKLVSFRGHHFLSNFIKPDSLVIDLGAHLGEFSHEVSDRFGCRSYAVEALPSLFTDIQESNLITKFNYAVTGTNGIVTFNISANPEGNSINLSMAEAAAKMNATNTLSHLEQKTVSISGITLETFLSKYQIPKIDLLKIDIEGAEIELFKSTSDMVLSKIKQITIEFHDFLPEFKEIYGDQVKEIKERLKSLGFFCIIFSPPNNNMDVLMVNTKECDLSSVDWLFLWYSSLRIYLFYNKHKYILGYKYIKKFLKLATK